MRELAFAANLSVADKPDSVEICFVPDGDHAKMIKQRMPDLNRPGMIVDESGNRLQRMMALRGLRLGNEKGWGLRRVSGNMCLKLLQKKTK